MLGQCPSYEKKKRAVIPYTGVLLVVHELTRSVGPTLSADDLSRLTVGGKTQLTQGISKLPLVRAG